MDCEIIGNEGESGSQSCLQKSENMQHCDTFNDVLKGNNSTGTSNVPIKGNSVPGTILMHSNIELTTPEDKQLNRRFTLRPRKCISKDIGSSLKKVMKRTLKNRYLKHQQLETIFEEPIVTKKGELVFIGLSKAKRSITFSQFVTKAKLKKRRSKVKKLKEKLIAEKKKMEDVESKLWKLGL